MAVFVTSDPHYNHSRAIEYSNRPFADEFEMNEAMIDAWNAVVSRDDDAWILGDTIFPWKHANHLTIGQLLWRLNGRKHLIIGNHDRETYIDDAKTQKIYTHWMWTSVQEYEELKFGKSRFVLCHYPLETWRNAHKGWYQLHGHCHDTLEREIPHRMDVGVDGTRRYDFVDNFAPYNLEALRDYLKAQPEYQPQDHHGKARHYSNQENYV